MWSVSDETILGIEIVDELCAKITILKAGNAEVKAETTDGSNLCAICSIDALSGINNIGRDEKSTQYYDLKGVPVAKPTKGIYIVVDGSKVKKIILQN